MRTQGIWLRRLNIILPLLSMGLVLFYRFCGSTCSYLKGGLFGIDLTYLGLFFAGLLVVAAIANRRLLYLLLLSAGIGSEVYLIGFQVKNGVYCPYCLIFAGVLFLLFVINFRVSRGLVITILAACGFLFFVLFFQGSVTPAYGGQMPVGWSGTARTK